MRLKQVIDACILVMLWMLITLLILLACGAPSRREVIACALHVLNKIFMTSVELYRLRLFKIFQ